MKFSWNKLFFIAIFSTLIFLQACNDSTKMTSPTAFAFRLKPGEDLKKGKEYIANSIQELAKIQRSRPNALLTRTFFDAKTDEIVQIFTGGPAMNNADLVDTLNRISPLNSSKWNNIR